MMNMNNESQASRFDSAYKSRVQDVENVLQDMKVKAETALTEKDDIMLGLYQEICRVITPVVQRYSQRASRESLASMNKEKINLRKERRAVADAKKAAEAKKKADAQNAAPQPQTTTP